MKTQVITFVIFLALTLFYRPSHAQINFKDASKEEVAELYQSLPASKLLQDARATKEINPDLKILDADSTTTVKVGSIFLYQEKWEYSYYLRNISPPAIFHGLINQGRTYVLMISTIRQRGLIFIKTADNYEVVAREDIAWVRGHLTEVKESGNGLIIVRITHLPGQNRNDSFLVINTQTKEVEVFD